MKIKLDENLPKSLVQALSAYGHDVDTVRSEGIAGAPDPDVWSAAQSDGRFLITQDLDFSDIRRFTPGTHCGLLLVRLPDAGSRGLVQKLTAIFAVEEVDAWAQCFVILSEHKLRVTRPTQ